MINMIHSTAEPVTTAGVDTSDDLICKVNVKQ